MSTHETHPESEQCGGCCNWQGSVGDFLSKAEKLAREEPAKAAGIAFIGGLIFTILPVGRIVGGLVRLALSLLRPALLVLGVVKVWEEIEKRADK